MYTYFIFSDVHGEYIKLINSLTDKGFDFHNQNHILISLGDSFDRGSGNLPLYKTYKDMQNQNRLWHIKGNHDDFFLDFLTGKDDGIFNIIHNGMDTTIQDFAHVKSIKIQANVGTDHYRYLINQEHPELREFLYNMPDILRIGNFILTHAGFAYDLLSDSWKVNNWAHTYKFFEKMRKIDHKYEYVMGHWHAKKLNHHFRFKEQGMMQNRMYVMNKMYAIDGAVNMPIIESVPILIHQTNDKVEVLDSNTSLEFLEL